MTVLGWRAPTDSTPLKLPAAESGESAPIRDFVDGLEAARLVSDRYPAGLPADEVAQIVTAVASALDAAHKQGLMHRDVKPANIMLTHLDNDGEQRILLTEFGIARNVTDISGLTATNMTVGTVAYCAPEQLLGEEIDGHRRRIGICLGEPPVQTIDQSLRFVDIAAKLQPLATPGGTTAKRGEPAACSILRPPYVDRRSVAPLIG